jgi:hypothetical protein
MSGKCSLHYRNKLLHTFCVETSRQHSTGDTEAWLCWEYYTRYLGLIFIGPCIVTYSYSATNKMHLLSQIIYSCKTLYIFRTVFPSIIRSSKLCIQDRYNGMRWNCSSILSPIAAGSSTCLTYTVAVYTDLSYWWWTERPSETCRAFYNNK